MKIAPHQAGLVDPTVTPPRIHGGECSQCGLRFFPPQSLGCERCGAHGAALRTVRLATTGVVRAAARVAYHGGRALDRPYVIAKIELEPGLLVRGVVDGSRDVRPGRKVDAVLRPVDPPGGERAHELRFAVRA